MDVPGLLTAAADRNTGVLKVFYVSSNELNIVTSAFGGGQWPPAPKPVI